MKGSFLNRQRGERLELATSQCIGNLVLEIENRTPPSLVYSLGSSLSRSVWREVKDGTHSNKLTSYGQATSKASSTLIELLDRVRPQFSHLPSHVQDDLATLLGPDAGHIFSCHGQMSSRRVRPICEPLPLHRRALANRACHHIGVFLPVSPSKGRIQDSPPPADPILPGFAWRKRGATGERQSIWVCPFSGPPCFRKRLLRSQFRWVSATSWSPWNAPSTKS
jgi:hypothetical protein